MVGILLHGGSIRSDGANGSSIIPAFPCIRRVGLKMKGHLAPASRRHLGTKFEKIHHHVSGRISKLENLDLITYNV